MTLAPPVRSMIVLIAVVLTACGGEQPTATDEGPTATEEGQAAPAGQTAPAEDAAAPAEQEPATQGDEGAITDAVLTYFNALATEDYATACRQLTPEAQDQVSVLIQAGQGTPSCEEAMEAGFAAYRGKDLAKLRDVQITSIEVTGDTATVAIQGGAKAVPLTRSGDVWLISQLTAG
ncbi:MAG TPA: hypothetical protein VG602_08985 [Actinomycetota bacterium]|nr:hypothetical protein [Actinomycetota bacterium]